MMLEKYKRYFPLAGVLALLILGWLTFYSVRETEFVLITQFGRPLYTVTDAGLHAKWFFQSTNFFDRRLRIYNPRPSEFLTHDKKNLVETAKAALSSAFDDILAVPRKSRTFHTVDQA